MEGEGLVIVFGCDFLGKFTFLLFAQLIHRVLVRLATLGRFVPLQMDRRRRRKVSQVAFGWPRVYSITHVSFEHLHIVLGLDVFKVIRLDWWDGCWCYCGCLSLVLVDQNACRLSRLALLVVLRLLGVRLLLVHTG